MLGEDLDAPLGVDRDDDRPRREIQWGKAAMAGIALLGSGLFVFARIVDDGAGGEPYAVATIETAPDKPQPSPQVEATSPPAAATPTAAAGVTRIEGQFDTENGVRVVRNGASGTPGALIIEVPSPLGLHLAPAPDRRLTERSLSGLIPKIGVDGTRPLDIYARPVTAAPTIKPGAPRIALVVGGMGLSQLATDHAIEALPGAHSRLRALWIGAWTAGCQGARGRARTAPSGADGAV